MSLKSRVSSIDEFGIHNYKGSFLAILGLASLYGIITILSFLLLYFEQNAINSNILNYKDAFWTLQMSASTIGFGDFFPVSTGGRIVVALMFYIGVGLVGFIGALIAERIIGFANTNIRNRELKKQNHDLLLHNMKLEKKIDNLINKIECLLETKSK